MKVKVIEFKGEPNQMVNVAGTKHSFRFDDKGCITIFDDGNTPYIDRLKKKFVHKVDEMQLTKPRAKAQPKKEVN